ncbi:MAG: hypothetical protein H6752_16810 [Candidatus Omnitrophica bacterium]|nr:hypothetical protein [Candidatus Omnitrophota bacterium]
MRTLFLTLLTILLTLPSVAQTWTPIVDEVYLQEIGEQVETDTPVSKVAFHEGSLYALMGGDLYRLQDNQLVKVKDYDSPATELTVLQSGLYVASGEVLHRFIDGEWGEIQCEGGIRGVCEHLGQVWVAADSGVYRLVEGDLEKVFGGGRRGGFTSFASFNETLYFLSGNRLLVYNGKGFEWENVVEWGEFLTRETRDLLPFGNRLLIATNRGLGELRGTALTLVRGEDGLPYEDASCLAPGFDRDVWIGTSYGAIRWTKEGDFHYFAGDRWLPDNQVHAIACSTDTAYIATDRGLGIVHYEPYTLQKKADYYDRHLEEWGQKRLGFVHKLEWNDEKQEWMREISDNDAGWSTHYLAAMCFKYAATKDPKARAEAVDFFNSLKWCEEITPIDGFPARSIWAVGEKGHQAEGGSGGFAAEWHRTEDGKWEWKGDTSSDETDAHYYATSIFHDLVAEGREKEQAIEHVERISDHIIQNGWTLRDVDGKPTVWARWDPEYFHSDRGLYARGLNGLEILSYMRTTLELSGEPRFASAYQELQNMDYHEEVIAQKLTFPPGDIFHSDDRLAFYAYYPLLKYETDPYLRSIYRRSFERSWEIERIERNPWFNFIYGALTGMDCEAAQAVENLREWPLDLIDYSFQNSQRADLYTQAGYTPYADGIRYFSPRERGPYRWTDSSLSPDGGAGGRVVVDPSGWLDAYWMGRFYGIILPPKTEDPSLLGVEERDLNLGAEPYQGPPRPELK